MGEDGEIEAPPIAAVEGIEFLEPGSVKEEGCKLGTAHAAAGKKGEKKKDNIGDAGKKKDFDKHVFIADY